MSVILLDSSLLLKSFAPIDYRAVISDSAQLSSVKYAFPGLQIYIKNSRKTLLVKSVTSGRTKQILSVVPVLTASDSILWDKIINTPTTLSQYGITDAYITGNKIILGSDSILVGSGGVLKPATSNSLGGIIVGDNLTVDSSGRLSATASYVLPEATSNSLGGIKVGSTLEINNGVLDFIDAPLNDKFYVRYNGQWLDVTLRLRQPNYIKVKLTGTASGRWFINSNSASYTSLQSVKVGAGDFNISFKPVSGYITPLNISTYFSNSWTSSTKNLLQLYILAPKTGYLKVNLVGCTEGGWSTLLSASIWNSSSTTMVCTVGDYTVYYKDVQLYKTPLPSSATVKDSLVTLVFGVYTYAPTNFVYCGLANAKDNIDPSLATLIDIDKYLTNQLILTRISQGVIKKYTLKHALLNNLLISNDLPQYLDKGSMPNITILVPQGYKAMFYNGLTLDYLLLMSLDYPEYVVKGTKVRTVGDKIYKLYTMVCQGSGNLYYKVFEE